MPLNSPINDSNENEGTLYIVSTPIGNMDDITLRAIKILGKADIIAAEDTRNTGKLLSYHNIKGHLVSFHEHNEKQRTPSLLRNLKKGLSVALVSDAGTPSVSDPGYRLVKAAITSGIRVVPIPGASAAITALSASGLPTDSFTFIGFPAKRKGKRHKQLTKLANESRTLVIYESPKRVLSLIEEIILVMGDRYGFLGREMTKPHEEFIRGLLSEILSQMKKRPSIKGECTLLIEGAQEDKTGSMDIMKAEIIQALALKEARPSDLAKEIAKKYGLPNPNSSGPGCHNRAQIARRATPWPALFPPQQTSWPPNRNSPTFSKASRNGRSSARSTTYATRTRRWTSCRTA